MAQLSFFPELLKNGSPIVVVAGILFAIWLYSSKAYLQLYKSQMKQMNDNLLNMMEYHTESNKQILVELTRYIHEDHKIKLMINETLSRMEVKIDNLKDIVKNER
ncbi:MAG: hypothetical protein LC102_09100 [Ignavibacteriales bacterium]|nr:MAG: hypothetical protein F9K26_05395 [Ignavibacteriaceae bacterium]MBW7872851.1 hypothetical protein [Ignavibacteria bacterium]MCZ2143571.1 hypothetical protein [Ignavibacteriales bacterium]OQY73327.1 MAG: hypothetical protein B6D45_08275 [Ignavibacteriales bacterium UTCHB3]MBV6444446.1 hypothetical protein [Ignavibacteriaceae bacterium]